MKPCRIQLFDQDGCLVHDAATPERVDEVSEIFAQIERGETWDASSGKALI
jgi:hypothetical protein